MNICFVLVVTHIMILMLNAVLKYFKLYIIVSLYCRVLIVECVDTVRYCYVVVLLMFSVQGHTLRLKKKIDSRIYFVTHSAKINDVQTGSINQITNNSHLTVSVVCQSNKSKQTSKEIR